MSCPSRAPRAKSLRSRATRSRGAEIDAAIDALVYRLYEKIAAGQATEPRFLYFRVWKGVHVRLAQNITGINALLSFERIQFTIRNAGSLLIRGLGFASGGN